MNTKKKVVIIGGVAGGMSAAARARRLSEDSEIIVLERGPHVSFANCGLPYFVGGEIKDEAALQVQTPETLRATHNLDVRVLSEVVAIEPEAHAVKVRNRHTGEVYSETFDALVIATGSKPLLPPIPGIENSGHFTVRNIPDVVAIDKWIDNKKAQRAVVVGGGYIGLEMAEQLRRRGLEVALAEALPQVMAPLDAEMAALIHGELRRNGVELHLGDGVDHFETPEYCVDAPAASVVVLKSGARLPADLVILGLGVRAETKLAQDAGINLGVRGGITVDANMRTNQRDIWAVGDAVEVRDPITHGPTMIPLAGPANRQGRIAADNIFGGSSRYRGTFGTAVLRIFDLTAACTGANKKVLQRAGIQYEAVHLHPGSHAGYYPGAETMSLKLLFSPHDGSILGSQIVGKDGIDKRIDVLATALQARLTVDDLAELELAYAPPYGSAKDPINLAGMIAQNVRSGDLNLAQWHEVADIDLQKTTLLDVRTLAEVREGAIPGAIHIPLPELRSRLNELPPERDVITYCKAGQRAYYASRILQQHGFHVRILTGSYSTWKAAQN